MLSWTETFFKSVLDFNSPKQEGHDGPGFAHLSFPDYKV